MKTPSDKYKNILHKLKTHHPNMEASEDFSLQVIQQLKKNESQSRHNKFSSDSLQWKLFIGFRNAMAIAAVFLIGYFVFQQWEIMSKVTQLEQELRGARGAETELVKVKLSNSERIQQILEKRLSLTKTNAIKKSDDTDPVILSRSSINSILESYSRLEKENRELKEIILNLQKKGHHTPSKTL